MNIKNKIVALIAALALSAITVACGSAPESSAPSESASAAESSASEPAESASTEESSEEAATGEQMTEEDYKAKVLELFNNVKAVAPEIAAADQNDLEAVLAATQKVADVTKASYGEMGELAAPDSFADAHADIKEGAVASSRLMDISLEMVSLGQADMTEEEATAKIAGYQTEITELSVKAAKMNDALIAVLGADVVGGAVAAE